MNSSGWNEYQKLSMETMRKSEMELTVNEKTLLQACLSMSLNLTILIKELGLTSTYTVRPVHFTMMGLIGESGELIDLVKKVVFHKQRVDRDDIVDECGDVFWYIATTTNYCGFGLGHLDKPINDTTTALLALRNAVGVIAALNDIPVTEILERNVTKLHYERYPYGFTFGGGKDRE